MFVGFISYLPNDKMEFRQKALLESTRKKVEVYIYSLKKNYFTVGKHNIF